MADGTPFLTTAPPDAPPSDGGEARPLVERQLEVLGELVDIGLKIARAIERQVDGPEPQSVADLNAAAIAFARVAQAVRQTIMLQNRLLEVRSPAAARTGGLRVRVARIVRRAIDDEHDDAEQAERLATEAAEGLEQERYGDILTRPVREIVADICKDLGLSPDWRGLAAEITAAEAFARGEGADAAEPEDDGPIELYWIGKDGRPTPAPAHPYTERLNQQRRDALRRDTS